MLDNLLRVPAYQHVEERVELARARRARLGLRAQHFSSLDSRLHVPIDQKANMTRVRVASVHSY